MYLLAKLNNFLILLLISAVGIFGYQKPVFANHSGAIEISKNTYSFFLYIMLGLGVFMILVLARIMSLTKKIKGLNQGETLVQEKLYQRKFLSICGIFLIIGFLSVGAIYFFLRSAAGQH